MKFIYDKEFDKNEKLFYYYMIIILIIKNKNGIDE